MNTTSLHLETGPRLDEEALKFFDAAMIGTSKASICTWNVERTGSIWRPLAVASPKAPRTAASSDAGDPKSSADKATQKGKKPPQRESKHQPYFSDKWTTYLQPVMQKKPPPPLPSSTSPWRETRLRIGSTKTKDTNRNLASPKIIG